VSVLHRPIIPIAEAGSARSPILPNLVDIDPVPENRRRVSIEGTILAKRYLIQSALGRGGFGITFLARNLYLPGQPLCVIKKLSPRFTDPTLIATARWRFYLEAKSLSRLASHAQVPTLMDYFKIGTDLYLVEQYIPGRNLTQIITQQRKFTESEVENFLFQMLHLLEYIHSYRLIHRDIKPQNIILCRTDLRFVLVDFGAVKDIDPPSQRRRDSAIVSRAIGTPGFSPPEQLADRSVYASDIYGLGMTCLYLLTGKEPTQLPTDPISCELVWSNEVEINVDLHEIISKMVRISLAERYQSATEVLMALENRTVRAKLRRYLHQKSAISTSETSPSRIYYPPVIHWALEILGDDR
jgi:serine/threonine protein kinase